MDTVAKESGMSEYINLEDAIKEIARHVGSARKRGYITRTEAREDAYTKGLWYAQEAIKDYVPSIDIVRCKECLLFNRTYHYCRHFNKMSVNTDDYCSYGERAKQTEPQTDCSWK